jgi:hypothetical protein
MTTQDLAGEITSYSLTMVTEVCINCGIPFAIPKNYQERLREKHTNFFCPNGHTQYYPGESDTEKLARQLRERDNQLAQTATAKIQLENQLNEANRKLKKVAAGQCPCCNKTYKHLASHMNKKHPEFKK